MRRIIFSLLFTIIFSGIILPISAQVQTPVTWHYTKTKLSNNEYELSFVAHIEPKWHLYAQYLPVGNFSIPTTFTFDSISDVELIDTVLEKSEVHEKYEELAGAVSRWFENEAVFIQKVRITGNQPYVSGSVDYMTCNDEQCIGGLNDEFEFTLAKSIDAVVTQLPIESNAENGKSLWSIILEAILWGFAALLTPCVFPMVPMTVSFFLKSSDNKAKSRFMASAYGLSIVALYTIPIAILIGITYFIGGESITADAFNWLSTHWIPNLLFFIIFMVFAASFFGAFEIVLPSKFINKADAKADKGGLLGTFFMAMTLVLVSFSCTGPIVGSIIVKSTQGEIWEPIITMLAFSLAFALPFTLFAFFPTLLNKLPKSGGWLNSVKVVLGFIEVALGLKFLSVADQTYHWGILDREVYLAIWIVTFSLLGLYLLGKIKFVHDSGFKHLSVSRLGLSIIVLSFVVYLIPGMWGAPLKALAGYLPPQTSLDFDTERIVRDNIEMGYDLHKVQSFNTNIQEVSDSLCEKPKYSEDFQLPHGIKGYFDFKQALACAKAQNKPLFVDFTGHGCVNCREMESVVWKDPEVLKMLKSDFVVVALYVDDKVIKLPEEEWTKSYNGKIIKTLGKLNADIEISRFNTNAQPYYCLLNTDGNLLVPPKAYDLNIVNFIDFLESGIKAFNQ